MDIDWGKRYIVLTAGKAVALQQTCIRVCMCSHYVCVCIMYVHTLCVYVIQVFL